MCTNESGINCDWCGKFVKEVDIKVSKDELSVICPQCQEEE